MAHDSHALETEPAEQQITVEALIAEPLLHDRLIGGATGVDRAVTWCLPLSEVDTTTAHRGVSPGKGGDLAGIAVHAPAEELASPEGARALVSRLAKRGVPAIFAWSRHRAAVDLTSAARAADSADLPLLDLPVEADYHHIGRLIATKVLSHTAHVLEYSVRVHQTLGEVFARGSGLQALAEAMATLAETPVLIADAHAEVLASVARRGEYTPDAFAEIAGTLGERLDFRSGEGAPGGYAGHARSHDAALEVESGSVYTVSAVVSVSGDPYGFVAILETATVPASHTLAQHRIAAEQGAALIAAEMLRQRSVREAEERAHDDFVDALVHGRFATPHEFTARARHHNFDTKARHLVLVVSADGMEADRRTDGQRLVGAARACQDSSSGSGTGVLAAQIGSVIVVVRPLSLSRGRRRGPLDEQQASRGCAEQLHRAIGDRVGGEVRVAYGRVGEGASGVAESYREARTALGLAARVGSEPVCGYDDLRVFAVIQDLAASDHGREFAREMLDPLRVDTQAGGLREIILAYIAESGNLNATARRLHLHRNTMLSKLDRASRVLRMDIRQADTQFLIWLAHHIDVLNSVTRSLDTELSSPV